MGRARKKTKTNRNSDLYRLYICALTSSRIAARVYGGPGVTGERDPDLSRKRKRKKREKRRQKCFIYALLCYSRDKEILKKRKKSFGFSNWETTHNFFFHHPPRHQHAVRYCSSERERSDDSLYNSAVVRWPRSESAAYLAVAAAAAINLPSLYVLVAAAIGFFFSSSSSSSSIFLLFFFVVAESESAARA